MKMFLLSSDEDTLTGLRLAGIDGKLVKEKSEFVTVANEVSKDDSMGILLVTSTLGSMFPDEIVELKKDSRFLVTEIPDMLHDSMPGDSITRYVRDAVGVKI